MVAIIFFLSIRVKSDFFIMLNNELYQEPTQDMFSLIHRNFDVSHGVAFIIAASSSAIVHSQKYSFVIGKISA